MGAGFSKRELLFNKIHSFFVCVCMCASSYGCVCVYAHTYTCMHLEARRWHPVSYLNMLHFTLNWNSIPHLGLYEVWEDVSYSYCKWVSDESPNTLLGRERAWADTVDCLRILDSSRAERLQLDYQVRSSCSLPCCSSLLQRQSQNSISVTELCNSVTSRQSKKPHSQEVCDPEPGAWV